MGGQEVGDPRKPHHILEAQDVLSLLLRERTARIIHQLIGHAAGLRAGTTVSTAPADETAHETLPRVTHTECPMNKNFNLHIRLVGDLLDFRQRKLARKHHTLESMIPQKTNAIQI